MQLNIRITTLKYYSLTFKNSSYCEKNNGKDISGAIWDP